VIDNPSGPFRKTRDHLFHVTVSSKVPFIKIIKEEFEDIMNLKLNFRKTALPTAENIA
jgi:hypothetical protein